VEEWLLGPYPGNGTWLGLHSYWESAYHHQDTSPAIGGTEFTHYLSFTRLVTKYLKTNSNGVLEFSAVGNPLEATYYRSYDHYQGLLILFRARSIAHDTSVPPLMLEARVEPRSQYRVVAAGHDRLPPDAPVGRLKNFAVASKFDVKELVFRNPSSLIGPYSEVVMVHEWEEGEAFEVSIVWIDPTNKVAASFDTKVPEGVKTFHHKPDFTLPLRPGVWKVTMMYQWILVAVTHFLVSPLSHVGRDQAIGPDIARVAHGGPMAETHPGHYTNKNFSDFDRFFDLEDHETLLAHSLSNASLVGPKLTDWIDDLVSQFHLIHSVCLVDDQKYEADADLHAKTKEQRLAREGASHQSRRQEARKGGKSPAPDTPEEARQRQFEASFLKLSGLSRCEATDWSSLSPDPKSEFGPVDFTTGRMLRQGEKVNLAQRAHPGVDWKPRSML